jgi:glycosyltransferase involved in cell wall biosynthesis
MAPRVSVVMPVFNGERYLAAAVESVLGQTLQDIELVVVDDASSDASRQIIERFGRADRRVRLVANDENLGVAGALNRGWREARASNIAIAHADDVALPDRLSRQVEFLDIRPNVAAVGGAVITIDAADRRGSTLRFPTSSRMIHATLARHNCLAHPSVMLRRSALEHVGGYRFDYVEDYDLWLRLSEHFELANLAEPLVLYRIHADQLSLFEREEIEKRRIVVRDAARARRTSCKDPLADIELPSQILAGIEFDKKELARAVELEWLGRAATLADLDRLAEAEELIERASRTFGHRTMRKFEAARELKRAETLLGAGRPVAGVVRVLHAFRCEPRYAFSRLTAWLADHVRGSGLVLR